MAKRDIPFDLFFERYYPKHGRRHITSEPSDFFKAIDAVSLDDLQTLSDEEMNCIPTGWLYDWLHCNSAKYLSADEYIEKICQKKQEQASLSPRQFPQLFNFIKRRKAFTAEEAIQATGSERDIFLGVMYSLFVSGKAKYHNGEYAINGLD